MVSGRALALYARPERLGPRPARGLLPPPGIAWLFLRRRVRAIERAAHVEPALVWGGFKMSLTTSIFGLVVFAGALLVWFVLRGLRARRASAEGAAVP